MQIVADENMPYAREWFSTFGTVLTVPGRAITADILRGADALLVRSVTRVTRELLAASRVRFVGTATSGIEHLDIDYLQSCGIAYAGAPGCNATAVVEYVLSCFAALDGVLEKLFAGGSVGVIGMGNVGARLIRRLQSLGFQCVGYDPYLTAETGLPLCALDDVLQADIICCHTPLTESGLYPTKHLIDAKRLRNLRSDTVLINASRGAVVDNAALLQILRERKDLRVVLDVWETEPLIDVNLLDLISIATPHIAGYSWDGKVAGTRAVLEAFCRTFNFSIPEISALSQRNAIAVAAQKHSENFLRSALLAAYDVRRDDAAMRAALHGCERGELAMRFDQLRKNYPQRREIAACEISNANELNSLQLELLKRAGFTLNSID